MVIIRSGANSSGLTRIFDAAYADANSQWNTLPSDDVYAVVHTDLPHMSALSIEISHRSTLEDI